MNPAARYIRLSEAHIAASVASDLGPSHDESGTISTRIWGITTYRDVFALHISLRASDDDELQDMCFTPDVADGISMSIDYSNGASALGGLGRRSVGEGVVVAKMESCVTDRRIDAHMAVSPLPSPGRVHISLTMRDGSSLGEWLLCGESILESSRTVMGYD